MKHTKKLIPAIGMLLLSACMLVTSTFAWFSMNEKVTATGMSVTAKGDQVYLQIINPNAPGTEEEPKAFVNGAAQTSAKATTATTPLLPVNVVKSINQPTTEGSGESAVTTYSCTAYDGTGTFKWVTNVGVSNTNGSASKQYDEVTADFANYYLKNTFHLRLDPTAGAPSSPALRVAGITVNASNKDFQKCLSVLVVSTVKNNEDGATVSTKGQVWEYNGSEFVNKTTSVTALSADTFSATTYAEVDIYVFFNGDNQYCTQAMLALAADIQYDVAVSFTVAAQQGN